MMCCGNNVCHNCIKENAFEHNNIVCMFCKIDHSVRSENVKYISQIEIHSKFNKKSWQEWWSKNDKLDMLAFN